MLVACINWLCTDVARRISVFPFHSSASADAPRAAKNRSPPWRDQSKTATLDKWLQDNSHHIHAAVFALIQPYKDLLKNEI